jgi:hypothetical protein
MTPNKAALLDSVAETVLAQLHVDPADPDWAAQLRTVARDYRQLALAHPNIVPLGHPAPDHPARPAPPGTLRPLENILALLTRAGFTGADALHVYRAVFGCLHGHVLNELQELIDNPDETDDLLRLGLYRLPVTEFPLLCSLAPALAAYDGATELERGLGILLTGLATALAPDTTVITRARHPWPPAGALPDSARVKATLGAEMPRAAPARSGPAQLMNRAIAMNWHVAAAQT